MNDDLSAGASSAYRRAVESGQRARQSVSVNQPLLFVAWGVVYLCGYGSLYLNVLLEHEGPPTVGFIIFGLLAFLAFGVTSAEIRKRFHGLRGATQEMVARIAGYWFILVVVWVALLTLAVVQYKDAEAGMIKIGAVSGATATLLVGMMYLLISRSFPAWQIGLGISLVSVGAGGLVAPPETSPLFVAVGAGASFFFAAIYSFFKH